ncbi:MAG TPA: hypothetical protein VHC43_06845 [Mycobacteriales bacterium]|nr:hypothetical protein [Mycobacteriales bacterium]
MTAFAGLVVWILTAGAAGCSSSSPSAPSPLIPTGPGGYRLVSDASRDQLPEKSVTEVTPADPSLTKAALDRYGFTGASSRIWKATTGDFLLDLAVRFDRPAAARSFASFELTQIADRVQDVAPNASLGQSGVSPFKAIPGASLYLLGGPNRQTVKPLFIEGVVFSSGTTTYLVETGGSLPITAAVVERYARLQASLIGDGGNVEGRTPDGK